MVKLTPKFNGKYSGSTEFFSSQFVEHQQHRSHGFLTDMMFVVSDEDGQFRQVHCHKAVVVPFCPLLKEVLVKENQDVVFLPEVAHHILIALLEIIYSGVVFVLGKTNVKIEDFSQLMVSLGIFGYSSQFKFAKLEEEEGSLLDVLNTGEIVGRNFSNGESALLHRRGFDLSIYEKVIETPHVSRPSEKVVNETPHVVRCSDGDEAGVVEIKDILSVSRSSKTLSKGKGIYLCEVDDCYFECTNIKNIKKHYNDDHPRLEFLCQRCNLECRNFSSLHKHRKQEHPEIMEVFECFTCNVAITTRIGLDKHVKQSHPEDDCTVSEHGAVDQVMEGVKKTVVEKGLSSSAGTSNEVSITDEILCVDFGSIELDEN